MSSKRGKNKPAPAPRGEQVPAASKPAAPDSRHPNPQKAGNSAFVSREAQNRSGSGSPSAAAVSARPARPFFWPCILICAVVCFFAVAGAWQLRWDSQLIYALAAAAAFLIVFSRKEMRGILRENLSPLPLLLFALSLLYFAGMFYGWFQKLALREFFLTAGGFFYFSVLYLMFLKNRETAQRFLSALAVCIGVVSLVSIELATSGLLFAPLHAVSALLGEPIAEGFASFEANTRITTSMDNPNVFAAMAAIGVFLSLQRHGAETDRLRRSLYLGLGILCGVTFVLCFSLGSFAAVLPAIIIWLLLGKSGERKALLIPAVLLIIASFIGAGLVFASLNFGVLPLFLTLALSFGAGFASERVRLPAFSVSGFLRHKQTVAGIVVAVLAVLFFAAFFLRGAYLLGPGESIRRAEALKSGDYTLSAELSTSGNKISVEVTSMSYTQAALKESTVLASGGLASGEHLSFTVPEGSAAVYFRFSSDAGTLLKTASYSGASGAGTIPLRYLMVPEFIVNRLQGLWVNDNAIQRLVFFRDGIRLGLTSPLIGLGGGAFEGADRSVADYYYETAHTHNQYIQSFVDGGIIGLGLFAALAVFAFRALYLAKKKGLYPQLLPYLGGAVSLVFLHSMIEIDFMQPAFRTIACALLAVLAALFPVEQTFSIQKPAKRVLTAAAPVLAAAAILLSVGRIWALQNMKGSYNLDTFRTAALLDPFNGDDYKLSFLMSTAQTNSISLLSQDKEYLESIENRRIIPGTAIYLVRYYLQKADPDFEKAAEMAEIYIRGERVKESAWDDVFSQYSLAEWTAGDEGSRKLAESVDSLCSYLMELNRTLPQKIEPSQALAQYLWAEEYLRNDGVLVRAGETYDLNCDGVSDFVTQASDGSTLLQIPAVNSAQGMLQVKVYQAESMTPSIRLNGDLLTCGYRPEEGCWLAEAAVHSDSFQVEIGGVSDTTDCAVSLNPSD